MAIPCERHPEAILLSGRLPPLLQVERRRHTSRLRQRSAAYRTCGPLLCFLVCAWTSVRSETPVGSSPLTYVSNCGVNSVVQVMHDLHKTVNLNEILPIMGCGDDMSGEMSFSDIRRTLKTCGVRSFCVKNAELGDVLNLATAASPAIVQLAFHAGVSILRLYIVSGRTGML